MNLDELKRLYAKATKGPIGWFGDSKRGMYLATHHSGRHVVMDFTRHGMNGAQPRFRVDGHMVPASALAVHEVCPDATTQDDPRLYRHDIVDIRHPDAQFIPALHNAFPALVAELEALRGTLGESRQYITGDMKLDCLPNESDRECLNRNKASLLSRIDALLCVERARSEA